MNTLKLDEKKKAKMIKLLVGRGGKWAGRTAGLWVKMNKFG